MTVPPESILALRQMLGDILTDQLPENGSQWLESRVNPEQPASILTAFVAAPRMAGKLPVSLTPTQRNELAQLAPGFNLSGWPLDRVTRLYLLLLIPADSRIPYIEAIQTLFDTAEMNEQVALYSSLSVLPYADEWVPRATDAVRSNIGVVFDALALGNPYPAQHFSELAWNQLVMKTIFNDKSVGRIVGLAERRNPTLARIFIDFVHERWAAGRQVPPRTWQLVAPYVTESMCSDLIRMFHSERPDDRRAAALVCLETAYEPARALLRQFPVEGDFSWNELEVIQA